MTIIIIIMTIIIIIMTIIIIIMTIIFTSTTTTIATAACHVHMRKSRMKNTSSRNTFRINPLLPLVMSCTRCRLACAWSGAVDSMLMHSTLSIHLSSIYLSIYQFIHPSIYLSTQLPNYLSIHSIIYVSIYTYMHPSIHPSSSSIHPSTHHHHLSIYLYLIAHTPPHLQRVIQTSLDVIFYPVLLIVVSWVHCSHTKRQ